MVAMKTSVIFTLCIMGTSQVAASGHFSNSGTIIDQLNGITLLCEGGPENAYLPYHFKINNGEIKRKASKFPGVQLIYSTREMKNGHLSGIWNYHTQTRATNTELVLYEQIIGRKDGEEHKQYRTFEFKKHSSTLFVSIYDGLKGYTSWRSKIMLRCYQRTSATNCERPRVNFLKGKLLGDTCAPFEDL